MPTHLVDSTGGINNRRTSYDSYIFSGRTLLDIRTYSDLCNVAPHHRFRASADLGRWITAVSGWSRRRRFWITFSICRTAGDVCFADHSNREPEVDVNECIQEALTLLRSPLRKVGVNLSLSIVPAITASKGELVQIWANLMKNACESLRQADIPHPELHVRSSSDDTRITVQIEDNGPGIAPKMLPHIFQPDVTTKVGGLSFGLSLGLTIVQRLVNGYAGQIEVTSQPGETIFTVELPII